VRIDTPLAGRQATIVCSLDRPGDKIIPLLFLAATARDLGATGVGLVAPYLAFMRQDQRFRSGEGITSVYFAALLSRAVDWLVTVDPHLHRFHSLDELYTIPTRVARAAPSIARWIGANVADPILIGPDAESAQWVSAVAALIGAPHAVLDKVRRGDRDVEVSLPDPDLCQGRTPVIIDDIISTARTMIEPVRHLLRAGVKAPVCIGVHAVFTDGALGELEAAGAARVVTCNTIAHHSNAIYVDDALAAAVGEFVS
jgi:ribose-phosphate pyrophosphokinase